MVKRHGNTLGEYITADAIDALFQIFPVGHGGRGVMNKVGLYMQDLNRYKSHGEHFLMTSRSSCMAKIANNNHTRNNY